ncbi:hypothetical protein [Microbacterium sp. SS28]|uniref:hypothetical protein n=1 Tax=Microbacterium sp. SS28 TaxID=2919948 RepID=UPI001FA993EB|nr:hypothetical protein [Microbacterium sp. SS28]
MTINPDESNNKPQPGWLDYGNPDLQALILTFKFVGELMRADATADQWNALKDALVAENTADELANMLIGACTIHARSINEADARGDRA